MQKIKTGDTITVHYTGTLEDGSEFDTSRERGPLQFTVGAGELIAGFEQAVVGMIEGDEKSVVVGPDLAYGERTDDMLQVIPLDDLPDDIELQIGLQLHAEDEDEEEVIVLTVVEFDDEEVTLDANHLLAGQTLTFDIEVLSIDEDANERSIN
jgi:FKBP-type peptidyl-prolyl cis-trans isomerase 2